MFTYACINILFIIFSVVGFFFIATRRDSVTAIVVESVVQPAVTFDLRDLNAGS